MHFVCIFFWKSVLFYSKTIIFPKKILHMSEKSSNFAAFLNVCKIMKGEPLQKVDQLPESQQLYTDVCHIIDETRTRVAVYVNAEVCHTNWLIGKRIKEDILYNKRAE